MKKIILFITTVYFILGSLNAQTGVKIIVNTNSTLSSISKSELSNVFLKKVSEFNNGTPAKPVDQSANAPARTTFSSTYLGKPVSAVKNYWNQQLFSGAGIPPEEKPSDADVISFIKSTPGGIGYVSSNADIAGVKVIPVQ
jgi:ABC-type phosphate transport system substrate-binding protein